jgi:tRNA-specific 2-thiouridylase
VRVLVAMSGGVDSSVAAALLAAEGHEVVGATLKLWGGSGDLGCCSVADVDDARRVADQLGIEHRVFNFTDEFATGVVEPYVVDHAQGRTPNPCVECNRAVKFGHLADRARRLGFDAIATGHHARVSVEGGRVRLRRGADRLKDQSYVLSTLSARELARVLMPIGELTKPLVRELAGRFGLRTAAKPDSQDVCFIASRSPGLGRSAFLAERIPLHAGRVVDVATGAELGALDAVELVTVGQRRGLGVAVGDRRYAVRVDVASATVFAGSREDLLVGGVEFRARTWFDVPLPTGSPVLAQASAHGPARRAVVTSGGIEFHRPERRVAPGQVVACYVGDRVVGSGVAR